MSNPLSKSSLFWDFRSLTADQIITLESTASGDAVKDLLRSYFNLNYDDVRKNVIATEFHFYNYAFAKEKGFNIRAIATFMSIMNEVFINDTLMTNPMYTRKDSYDYFEKFILQHSVDLPPKSIKIFKEHDVASIVDFATESYFRQWNLYKYIFSKQEKVVVTQVYVPQPSKAETEAYPVFDFDHVRILKEISD